MNILDSYKLDSVVYTDSNPNVTSLMEAMKALTEAGLDVFTGEQVLEYARNQTGFRQIGQYANYGLWAYYSVHLRRCGMIHIKIEE